MTLTRIVTPAVGLLCLGLVAMPVTGCGGKKKSSPDSAAFKSIPREADFLAGINGKKLREKGAEQIASRLPSQIGKIVSGLKSCGIDVLGGTDSAILGGSSKTRRGVGVIKGFSQENFVQCGEVAKEYKVAKDGTTMSMEVRGISLSAAWIDATTLVGGAFWDAAELTGLAAGKGGADGNKKLIGFLDDVDTSAAIWFVFAPEDASALPLGSYFGNVEAAFGEVEIGDRVTVKIGAKMKDAKAAKSTASGLRTILPGFASDLGELGETLKKVEIGNDGRTLRLKVTVTTSELAKIARTIENDPNIKAFLGGD